MGSAGKTLPLLRASWSPMKVQSDRPFVHRYTIDGTIESICMKCFLTGPDSKTWGVSHGPPSNTKSRLGLDSEMWQRYAMFIQFDRLS
jgi:hypothetical protein